MLSKSQARAFFLGGTGLFTAAFLALTYDSHRQVPKQTNEDKLTAEVIAGRGKPWLRLFLKDPQAMFPGERKMQNYEFTDEEIENVITFLEWCGEVDLNGFPAKPPLGRVAAPPAVASTVPQPALFTAKGCIGCHSVGGIGGNVGPALDTIAARMDGPALKEWISDPQKIKPGTAMPKLPMTPEELEILVDYLQKVSK